jgi:hypothetical protein
MSPFDTTLTDEDPATPRLRDVAAALLRAASRTLDSLAVRLAAHEAPAEHTADLEFHADAGAPEGALYVNGQLVAYLPGVNRL